MMFQKVKLTVGQMVNHPTARVLLILGIMVLAALVAGAPNDWGGG